MLTRKPSSKREERDWFSFAAGLMHSLCSDYIAVRILYGLEPLTTAFTIVPKMLDVVEKSFKLHVAVRTQASNALSMARSEYGHNIEKLRAKCATFDSVFDDADICLLTRDLRDQDGKFYQHMRYGSQETTAGSAVSLASLMPVVDKIFVKSLVLLPDEPRKQFIFACPLKNLLTRSRFDRSQYPEHLEDLLRANNAYLDEFIACCQKIDEDHAALLSASKVSAGSE